MCWYSQTWVQVLVFQSVAQVSFDLKNRQLALNYTELGCKILFSAETNYYKMWPCKCHLYRAGWGRANAWTVELWASQGSIPELQCLESESGALVLQHVNGGLLSYCVSLCEYDAWNCAVWSPAPASTTLGPAAVSALLVLVPAAELTDGNWEQAWK